MDKILNCEFRDESSILSKIKMIMKNIKTIKFLAPSKLSMNSKDEFMTKLKPVLGQNQINLVNFVNDFNKKTFFLADNNVIELNTKILKKADKSFIILISLPGASILKNQFLENGSLSACHFQDILRLKNLFEKKNNTNNFLNQHQTARVLLSNFQTLNIKIINE